MPLRRSLGHSSTASLVTEATAIRAPRQLLTEHAWARLFILKAAHFHIGIFALSMYPGGRHLVASHTLQEPLD